MNGIINVYKPSGITSHTVVAKIRRFTGVRRVGHSGTLDPMAKGVLPVLVGSAAGVQELITGHDKVYRAGLLFGKTTETADITGSVIEEKTPDFTPERLNEVLASFVGTQMQTPPMYSALKVDGKKLCDLARAGVEVERKAREITIYSIKLTKPFDGVRCEIDVACSKGTYIRTLGEDIGKALGCGACLDSLERLQCGIYKAENAVSLDTLEQMYNDGDADGIEKMLESPEKIFDGLPEIRLPSFFARLASNGAEIYIKKIRVSEKTFEKSNMCKLFSEKSEFLGVGILSDFPDGKAIKLRYRF